MTFHGTFESTDKGFWHHYLPFYERYFAKVGEVKKILEFGIFRGHSVRWLMGRFPDAQIHAADILKVQDNWPKNPRVHYHQVDQNDDLALTNLYKNIGRDLDLILEDGSHRPKHQARCLALGFDNLRDSGLYLLEDVHTSLRSLKRWRFPLFSKPPSNTLNVLLAFQHLKIHNETPPLKILRSLEDNRFFSLDELKLLYQNIAHIELYRRCQLPEHCYACGKRDFDYRELKCRCGRNLFAEADSMSFALIKGHTNKTS